MKKLFLTIVLMASIIVVNAQTNWVGISSSKKKAAETNLVKSDIQSSQVKFSLEGFVESMVSTPKGIEKTLSLYDGVQIMEKGAPDLGKEFFSIIIPDTDEMAIKIVNSQFVDYKGIDIAPSKGHLYRNVNPEDVPFEYSDVYSKDAFWPGNIAQLEDPFIMRDVRGQTVTIFPFQYNAVTKTLRVYYDIELEIYSTGNIGKNTLSRRDNVVKIDPEFNHIYNRMFLNNKSFDKSFTIIEEEGSMLIICFDDYMNAMKPFVDWKRTIGRKTTIVPKSTAGTTAAAIKTFVTNYYNENDDFTYLLIVGDAPQIPTNSTSWGHSDNAYGFIVGADQYNEIIVGRFSAESVAQVQTQVQRMIHYERDITAADTWLNVGMGVARNEGAGNGHNGGEADYVHADFIRDTLLNYTYSAVHREYDGNVPGLPNTTASSISSKINSGVSIINYINHGSDTGWSVADYNSSHVNALTNIGKLPFIWAVACVNGNFNSITCFAEAWMRATHNGEPTGAIGTLMSTINQAWQPPMTGQDEMVTILAEKRGHIKRTYGGLSINGSMVMIAAHGASGTETHVTWNLFGDPSLMVRTDVPQVISASYNPVILLGLSTFQVNVDNAEGAVVSITRRNEDTQEVVILGTAVVNGGTALVEFVEPIESPGVATLAITAYNKVTYINDELGIIPPEGPYVVFKSLTIDDSAENNNGLADYSETVLLNVTLENVGVENAENITATLTSENEYVNIIDGNSAWGDIEAGELSLLDAAFTVSFADNTPDQERVRFTIEMTDGNEVWESTFNITVNAPVLVFQGLVIDDGGMGIPGILDPGETADIITNVKNIGHATSLEIIVTLDTESPWVTVNTLEAVELGSLAPGEAAEANFNVTALEETPIEQAVELLYTAATGEYTFEDSKQIVIGLIPVYLMGQSATVTAPIGRFYDTGGPTANYSNNENIIMTFYPMNPGSVLEFEFLHFDVEANATCAWDYLKIYNGTSTTAPLIGTYCGTNSPGTFMATNDDGAITFHFYSDGIIANSGWEAIFRAVNISEPPDCAETPNPANGASNIVILPGGKVSWAHTSGSFGYDVYFGENELPAEVTETVDVNNFAVEINSNSDYSWKVVPYNSAGHADGCPTWNFSTGEMPDIVNMSNGSKTTCNAIFYDSGGPDANYNNNEEFTFTFFPGVENANVIVEFLSFDVEFNATCAWDWLKIYNGPNISSPLLGTFCGTTSPGTITADNEQGALTFQFKADITVTRPGWEALVSCDITEVEIVSVNEISDIQVFIGTTIDNVPLPDKVKVSLADETEAELTVVWDSGTPSYDGGVTGLYVFEGEIEIEGNIINPSNFIATINVVVFDSEKQLASSETLENISAFYGTTLGQLELPTEVMVTTDDDYSLYLEVVWDEGTPEYNGTTLDSYLFEGEIQLIPGFLNDEDIKAYVTVIVVNKNITSVAGFAPIGVNYNTALIDLNLPADVLVTLEDATTVTLDIDWDNGTPAYDGSVPGVYEFEGSLELIDGLSNLSELHAYITVTVNFISATISPDEIDMYLNWPNEDKEIEILWHDAVSLSGFKFQDGEEWTDVPSEWYELEDHGDGTATLTIFASEIDMNKADHNVSDDNPWRIEFNMGNHAYGNTNMIVKTFTVTFVVKDEDSNVITGASVEFDTYDGNDNAGEIWSGSGLVYEVWASGDYEYTVSAEGFKPASDIISSVVEDLTINVVLEDETIGITEIDSNVKIYPNPSTGLFNIEFNGIKGIVNMTILNYQGQVVLSQTFNSDGAGVSQKLNLGEFAKGIYYVRIQSGDIIKVEKLILQ